MTARALARIVIYTAIVTAVTATTARASCGISDLPDAVSAAKSGRLASPGRMEPAAAPAKMFGVDPSIVGLWHTTFTVDVDGMEVTIQEAFQLWNEGGTEIHNPKVDPREGNVCLGVWARVAPRTFELTHRVWAWDVAGGFQGTLHLSETLTLGSGGETFSGTFTIDVHDPSGALVAQVTGNATGERVSVGDQ